MLRTLLAELSALASDPTFPLPLPDSAHPSRGFLAVAVTAVAVWLPTYLALRVVLSATVSAWSSLDSVGKNRLTCTTMSTVHAVALLVVAAAAVAQEMTQSGSPVPDPVLSYVGYTGFLTQFTAGYFLHDTGNQLFYNWGTPDIASMLAHHGFFLTGASLLLVFRVGSWVPMLWSLTEVSTPFVNARFIMVLLNLKDTPAYFYNGLAILVSFTGRVIVSLYICYVLLQRSESLKSAAFPLYAIQTLASIAMTGLNLTWYSTIVRMVWGKLTGHGKPKTN